MTRKQLAGAEAGAQKRKCHRNQDEKQKIKKKKLNSENGNFSTMLQMSKNIFTRFPINVTAPDAPNVH